MLDWNAPKAIVGQNVRKVKTRFQPQGWFSGGANAQPNQYIRWDFNTTGLWDPKSVYIYIEVDTSSMPADTIYQIDNSAQSFIGQYISRVNGVELERIQEYDEMAAYLYDMNIGLHERDAKSTEGIGMCRNLPSNLITRGQNSFNERNLKATTGGGFNLDGTDILATDNQQPTTMPTGGIISVSPPIVGFRPYLSFQTTLTDTELISNSAKFNFDGVVNSTALQCLSNYLDLFNLNDNEGHEPTWQDQSSTIPYLAHTGWNYSAVNNGGITRPMTATCVGGSEWWCSTTFPKATIKSGLPGYERNSYGTFCIPLLSPLFGTISSHGKLLPMEIFKGLEFEFLISPFAFFCGPSTWGSTGSTVTKHNSSFNVAETLFSKSLYPQSSVRTGWKITKMELVVDIYYLDKQSEDNYMNRLSNEGFNLDIKQWYLGPKIKYSSGASMNQTIQINNGFNSLNAVLFYFQPADYEIYSWCRKHKRISNNLTSLQLRIGNEYFPSLPIVGHSGNIRPDMISSTIKGNYVEFFINTMQCFGKFFNLQDDTLLNPSNYCTNHIGYDPSKFASGTISADQDVTLGTSLFYENQHIPRCLYALDLEKMDIIGDVRSGWDTTKSRPFDLLLQNDSSPVTMEQGKAKYASGGVTSTIIQSTAFPRPLYMYIWLLYDSSIKWSRNTGWSSEGRV